MQFSIKTLLSAAVAISLASAYTDPVGEPSGNPISKPGLNDIVVGGKPGKIVWEPTTEGTVTLVLLRGPSNNVQPLFPIAEQISNSGSYTWTPSVELEADTTGYGIQLIVDATGQFQYSTQFGISQSESDDSSATLAPGTGIVGTGTGGSIPSATSCLYCGTNSTANRVGPTGTAPVIINTAPRVASTGRPAGNSTLVRPTGTMSVPSDLRTGGVTPTAPSGGDAGGKDASAVPPEQTGGAGMIMVSIGQVIVGAMGIAMLV
ncbi:MAG: hypothetical protein M1837_001922 [Sclerophora amabilis]|nr:MAG: hypothetical protein M1837_001922 [Sclerophora amabilis]